MSAAADAAASDGCGAAFAASLAAFEQVVDWLEGAEAAALTHAELEAGGASMLGGAAVPVVGLTLGWRWAYVLATAFALVIVLPMPEVRRATGNGGDHSKVRRGPLLALAVGAACCTAAANAATTFLVPSLVEAGLGVGDAGKLLSLGGAVGVVARLAAGWAKDRYAFDGLQVGSALVVCGGAGFVLLGLMPAGSLAAVATVVAFTRAYGWSGLFGLGGARRG